MGDTGRQVLEVDGPETLLLEPGHDRARLLGLGKNPIHNAELVVDLHRARLKHQRPRLSGWLRLSVNDHSRDSELGQAVGQHQSGRTRPDDHHIGLHVRHHSQSARVLRATHSPHRRQMSVPVPPTS